MVISSVDLKKTKQHGLHLYSLIVNYNDGTTIVRSFHSLGGALAAASDLKQR